MWILLIFQFTHIYIKTVEHIRKNKNRHCLFAYFHSYDLHLNWQSWQSFGTQDNILFHFSEKAQRPLSYDNYLIIGRSHAP